jgi:hypothetical protein
VVVTAVYDPPLRVGIERLHAAGHTVVLVLVGDRAEAPALDVPVYRVRGEVGWRAMDEIHLV